MFQWFVDWTTNQAWYAGIADGAPFWLWVVMVFAVFSWFGTSLGRLFATSYSGILSGMMGLLGTVGAAMLAVLVMSAIPLTAEGTPEVLNNHVGEMAAVALDPIRAQWTAGALLVGIILGLIGGFSKARDVGQLRAQLAKTKKRNGQSDD